MKKQTWGDKLVSLDYIEAVPGVLPEETKQVTSEHEIVAITEEKRINKVIAPVKAKYLTRLPYGGYLVYVNVDDKKDARLVPFTKENYTSKVREFSQSEWESLRDATELEFVIDALKWYN